MAVPRSRIAAAAASIPSVAAEGGLGAGPLALPLARREEPRQLDRRAAARPVDDLDRPVGQGEPGGGLARRLARAAAVGTQREEEPGPRLPFRRAEGRRHPRVDPRPRGGEGIDAERAPDRLGGLDRDRAGAMAVEEAEDLGGPRGAEGPVGLREPRDQVAQVGRPRRGVDPGRLEEGLLREVAVEVARADAERSVEEVGEEGAEGEEVGPPVDLLATEHLGRREEHRPSARRLPGPGGEAEVGELDRRRRVGSDAQDVAGLEVEVDHAPRVEVTEGPGDLDQDRGRLLGVEGGEGGEVAPFGELAREVGPSSLRAALQDRGEARVIEAAKRLEFRGQLARGADLQHLPSPLLPEVLDEVDLPPSVLAVGLDDPVAPREVHGRRNPTAVVQFSDRRIRP